jgi:phosphoribosylglycinamide formyltransferase-1
MPYCGHLNNIMKSVAIFASGSGSNAENIIQYFKDKGINVDFRVYTNNSKAGVIDRCNRLKVPCTIFTRHDLNGGHILNHLKSYDPDLIVLAGFLLLVPADFVKEFPRRIVNVHPALLPKYGGKGMYGDNVHRAVIENKEAETGITIHYVNEHFDEGEIIEQSSFPISELSLEAITKQIHDLEYKIFPLVIEKLLK